MTRTRDELHHDREAVVNRLVDELALERGIDIAGGLDPDQRATLAYEVELLYSDWMDRLNDGEMIVPVTPAEALLAELQAIDEALDDERP
jgi:hypothetical protein